MLRRATFVTCISLLAATFIVAACASSSDTVPAEDTAPDSGAPKKADAAAPTTKDSGPQPTTCTAKCTTDGECGLRCETPKSGTYCCDVPSGTCYARASSSCPAPPAKDAGSPNQGGY